MSRRVVVTGATTPLGRAVLHELITAGASVTAIGLEEEVAARPLIPYQAAYAKVDLARPRAIHDYFFGEAKANGVDTVLHLATHRRFAASGEDVYALNVGALRGILACCDDHPTIRRVVYRSYAEVYRVDQRLPSVITEEHPLDHSAERPQWLRDRVEADGEACAKMGMAKVEVVVVRCADVFASGTGSQLYDYLRSKVCLQPLGFDPMINVLSLEDAAKALAGAVLAERLNGVVNVPGADTLPLSACIRAKRRVAVPLPGPLLQPLYALRQRVLRSEFSYRLNQARMHFPGILDGRRARELLGFVPERHVFT